MVRVHHQRCGWRRSLSSWSTRSGCFPKLHLRGRIIYLSSVGAVQAGPGGAPYGGSKAAVNILTNVAHQELAGDGIRTVAIAPGLTDTPGMRDIQRAGRCWSRCARSPRSRVRGRRGRPDGVFAGSAAQAVARRVRPRRRSGTRREADTKDGLGRSSRR